MVRASQDRLAEGRRFPDCLRDAGLVLRRRNPEILQINLGKLCNLTCVHCHVSAGPRRTEIIAPATVDRILDWYRRYPLATVDLTGGAPEMAPDFRRIVREVRQIRADARIIDRCNLVILNEPGYEWVGPFLEEQRVNVVASMPCYSVENVDAQRGNGVFDRSILALQELNRRGFGRGDHRFRLDLVYNPAGAFLPPDQEELEADYKRELLSHFGITFDHLICITNLPIARFASWLRKMGAYETYLQILIDSFNPGTVSGLMCRDTLSVSWRGEVFDCDFNQMLKLSMRDPETGQCQYLWDLTPDSLFGRSIQTGDHCFGCTAGAGSSCGGAIV